jgi:hypothetical protein
VGVSPHRVTQVWCEQFESIPKKPSKPTKPRVRCDVPGYSATTAASRIRLWLSLPGHVERKTAARWKEWEGWAIIHLHHTRFDMAHASTELARLRERHRQHLLTLLDAGLQMRLFRKHRLDDPRMTEEVRTLLVEAAIERRRKPASSSAWPLCTGLPTLALTSRPVQRIIGHFYRRTLRVR